MSKESIVFVVDDDDCICEAVTDLLAPLSLSVITFNSVAEYMAFDRPQRTACLILDVRLPDDTGLNLQARLADTDHPPIIFITGHGDVESSVRAIKAGAVDFLTKPFGRRELLRAVMTALDVDEKARIRRTERARLLSCFSTLTPREREVLPLVASGLLNKQAAALLGISQVTLQIHRGQVMRKMAAKSLAQLVRMADMLGICSPLPPSDEDRVADGPGIRA
ncbi:response regulator [Paraburkholderia sp. RL18-103-BIB-C]|uniref:response regulator transcription factor n=1 Tax=unclassified Paraburkholderia TaxID=2615204 RepID=UPI0038B7D5BC